MRCGVVIVGAGMGTRLGLGIRKAMVPLNGVPLMVRSAEAFAGIDAVDGIVLVAHPDDHACLVGEPWGARLRAAGVRAVVGGGERRQDSALNGIKALADGTEGVLVHDAARPFVSRSVVTAVAMALDRAPAAVPAVPVTSTIKRAGPDGRVLETLDRSVLWAAQTPQGGRRRLLEAALERAAREGWELTDDVQAMEKAGHTPVVVRDSTWNFKVTTAMDLKIAEWVLEAKPWEKE